jgi:hypothetical protein
MYEEPFLIERLVERDREIIRVQGELDIATAPQLESELGEVEGDGRVTGVCPVCLGCFRVSDGLLANHAPSPNIEPTPGQT